jgi:transposase
MRPWGWRGNWDMSRSFPPNPQRREPWDYDRALYRGRKEIERLFRRLKGYRRVFSRFDKLDVLFTGFVVLALIVEALR